MLVFLLERKVIQFVNSKNPFGFTNKQKKSNEKEKKKKVCI